ncbi:MAG TPA: type II toxin-antitoxin system HipA family toxin [Candidatus Binataceae bacterium]|nr:type II toxin-antitoxin system HipA family toxin [Candidatus Binataceae bacterium]
MTELLALLDGREVGTVRQERGRLNFVYADAWRSAPGAYPLSLSMPLAAAEHPHAAIDPFLWGLLPDNDVVLTRWARRFHVSPRNAFALISHVGEDCAGAVQFARPERRQEFITSTPANVEWLTDADVATRLRALLADASAGRAPHDTGQFSLAGAQPKTALLFDGQRWGVPSGREPTTHILKPPTGGFDGHAENEHLCLALARALGLPAARSEVRQFEDVTAIVVERYDRVRIAELAAARAKLAAAKAAEAAMHAASNEPRSAAMTARAAAEAADAAASAQSLSEFAKTTHTYRVHQEDFCQALRVYPTQKYQNDGGPGPKQIIDLLRANASGAQRPKGRSTPTAHDEDASTFLDALILNWLIGGTDAHAKNYSILIGGGGLVRLAPLYDIASIYGYPDIDPQKVKLAMRVGDQYRIRDIGLSQWRKLAADVRVDEDALIGRVHAMAAELPDRLADEVRNLRDAGLSHAVIATLANILPKRATRIASM